MSSSQSAPLRLALFIIFTFATITAAGYHQADKAPAAVSPLEYEVLSTYVNTQFVGDKGTERTAQEAAQIVIASDTQSDTEDPLLTDENNEPISKKELQKYLRKEAPFLQPATIANFRSVRANLNFSRIFEFLFLTNS